MPRRPPSRSKPLAGMLALLLISAATAAEPSLPAYSLSYDAERDPFADGRAALDLAVRTGRRVLIEVGGDWCSWCQVLDRVLAGHPEVAAVLRDGFVVLKVNVSEASPNTEFLRGLPALHGYPKLFVSRSDGVILQSQDPSAFFRAGGYDPELILAFLRRWAGAGGEDLP